MTALFAGKSKVPGPSEEQKAALKAQEQAITKREKEEKRKKTARDKVIGARQGRRGGLETLFQETGALGVPETGGTTFGGAGK